MTFLSSYKRNTLVLALSLGVLITFSPRFVSALTITPVRLEIAGDPGQTVTQEMTLVNERTTSETFYSTYANFEASGETGTPTFVDAKDDLGTWMDAPTSVVLGPGESRIIPVKINIPQNAEPGGHFASIFWGTTPKDGTPGEVSIGAKTGMLVLLRVNGEVSESGGVLEFAVKDKKNFFTALPVSFYYRFQNNGGDRVKPKGDVFIRNFLGIKSALIPANVVEGNVLPKSTRKFETAWQKKTSADSADVTVDRSFFEQAKYEWNNFALGYYTATLKLKYATNQTSESKVSFWVFPWHLLLILCIIALLLFFILRKGLKSYTRFVIAQAQRNLRREITREEKIHAEHKGETTTELPRRRIKPVVRD